MLERIPLCSSLSGLGHSLEVNGIVTLKSVLQHVKLSLSSLSDTPNIDAQVLLAHLLNRSKAWVLAHQEFELSSNQVRVLILTLERLEQGEPLPYVLGHWEFFCLEFIVNSSVLIPRPETELLVEQAISWLQANPTRRISADIGTGTGCIAISICHHITDLQMLASDLSWEALKIAKLNAKIHNVDHRITFLQSDLISAADLNLICANLPYIPTKTLQTLNVVDREPIIALDGGNDGLRAIRGLLDVAKSSLVPDGMLLFEIEYSQGATALKLTQDCFPSAKIVLMQDYAGLDRLIKVDLNGVTNY